MKVREKMCLGIHVGKVHHQVGAMYETGKVVFSKRLGNGQAEIEALIALVGKTAGYVGWVMDMTSGSAGLLPAVRWSLAAQLLADNGGELPAVFGSSAELAAYASLTPVVRDCGRVRGNPIRPKGKLHSQALIATGCRLIDVIWALLRDGRGCHLSPPSTEYAA